MSELSADSCPCGLEKPYSKCCGPYLAGQAKPPSAEALMRSRYTAFVKADIPYLKTTLHPKERKDFDEKMTETWATQSTWLGLEIVRTEGGGPQDKEGIVEFIANFKVGDVEQKHHEIAEFIHENGTWYFVDGKLLNHRQVIRETPKLGRNDPCSCGSGKKYKKCCGAN